MTTEANYLFTTFCNLAYHFCIYIYISVFHNFKLPKKDWHSRPQIRQYNVSVRYLSLWIHLKVLATFICVRDACLEVVYLSYACSSLALTYHVLTLHLCMSVCVFLRVPGSHRDGLPCCLSFLIKSNYHFLLV